jgi:hypothetical protein
MVRQTQQQRFEKFSPVNNYSARRQIARHRASDLLILKAAHGKGPTM